jgi:hypothetical protein
MTVPLSSRVPGERDTQVIAAFLQDDVEVPAEIRDAPGVRRHGALSRGFGERTRQGQEAVRRALVQALWHIRPVPQ